MVSHPEVSFDAVVSDKLVYLGLQKTASTFLSSLLVDLFGGSETQRLHRNEEDRSKFVIGSVRNPWDYYVSLWSYGCQGKGGTRKRATQRRLRAARRQLPDVGPLLRELTKPTRRWRAHYSEPHSSEKFNKWLIDMHTPARAAQSTRVSGRPRCGASPDLRPTATAVSTRPTSAPSLIARRSRPSELRCPRTTSPRQ